jgi:hypothetical protein
MHFAPDNHMRARRSGYPACLSIALASLCWSCSKDLLPAGPGNVLALMPKDTAAFVGSSYPLFAVVKDAHRNVRNDPVTYEAVGSAATVTATGRVTVNAVGRALLVARSGGQADSAWVSGVPNGSMVMTSGSELVFTNLDGSGSRSLPLPAGHFVLHPAWLPGTDDVLVLGSGWTPLSIDILRVTQSGTVTKLLPDSMMSSLGNIDGFRPGTDGRYVFLEAGRCNRANVVYRIDLRTGARERVSPRGDDVTGNDEDCWDPVDSDPSPSPDGTQVAVGDGRDPVRYVIAVIDVARHTRTGLEVAGDHPVWSPLGDLIAYHDAGTLKVIAPDGSGVRQVTPGGLTYHRMFNWTPDGKYLVVRRVVEWDNINGPIEIIRVSDGMRLPLRFRVGSDPAPRAAMY